MFVREAGAEKLRVRVEIARDEFERAYNEYRRSCAVDNRPADSSSNGLRVPDVHENLRKARRQYECILKEFAECVVGR
jgi:hypothetical protein